MKSLYVRLFAALCLFSSPFFLFAQLPSYLPADGLVAWYPFNGNANDESGNGNNGVVNGATLVEDRLGNPNASFLFDGIDDNIIVQNSSSLETSNWSINVWFKTSSFEFNRITSKDDPSNPYNDLSLIVLNGKLYISTSINGQTNTILPICQNNLADNSWHHVIASRVNGAFLIYVDGDICSSVNDYFPAFSTPNPLYIGSPSPYPSQYFDGQLDDIAIYNRALTQAEVTALYTATAANTGGGTTTANPAPPGIPYQAEVRNESGEVLANANVNVRFTLHELTANGAVSFQETHAVTTNELGLFATTIGGGTATQGTFAGINWSQTTKFLQVEVDAGNGYITLGNQQLMSVPYALYAANGPAGPQGPVGQQGPHGNNGLSAYEIWLAEGNSGDEQDFINDLAISSGSFIGQMNYWNGSQWIPVPIGNDGDVLSLQNGIPTWKPNVAASAPIFTIGDGAQDIDGNNYKSIIIGNQEWFSENLKTTRYNNGDAIQYGADSLLWTTTQSGSYAFYNNDGALDSIYGKWYNRYAIKDTRGICPVGWHVPNDQEWSTLIFQLGGNSVAGGKMKALTTWNWPNLGANNASGFTGLSGGVHYGGTNGWGMGMIARWWSSTEFNLSTAYYKGLGYNNYGIEEYYINNWNAGLNVRCLKN